MSSGVEADIALDAAVILSLGMTRVLGGAADLAASGASALAALAEGRAEAREAALREAERYERAIRAAIDLNARISALAGSARRAAERHGLAAEVALPAPISLGGRSPEELADWCVTTGAALDEAEQRLSADIAAAVTGQIFTLPAESLRAAAVPDDAPAETAARAAERVAGTLARVLARVLPDTSEADQAHIAAAAERLATAPDGEVEGLLTEVRLRVQAANRGTEQARAEVKRLAAEEEARRQAEAERRYVLDTIAATFGELGYEVDTGFETMTARDGDVLLTRGGWPEHAVKLRIDQDGDAGEAAPAPAVLRAAMLRAGAPQSEEERRLDVEREREWCDAFEEARSRLSAAGIRSAVRWRVEPGEQRLPTVPEVPRARAQARQRERQAPRE